MDVSSDMQVLNNTLREGNVWSFPALKFNCDMSSMSGFQAAEMWCKMIRSEHERQAGEVLAKERQEAALRRDSEGPDEGAGVKRGDGQTNPRNLPAVEGTVEEILNFKLAWLEESLETAREAYHAAKTRKFEAAEVTKHVFDEIRAVRAALKVTIDVARQDVNEMGDDLCTEVHGGGQTDSGAVGDTDGAQTASQGTSGESEGVSTTASD
jgi:hypothetical protein